MKIIKLTVEGFKRISAVEIEPSGALVVISGKNGAGKSTLLDAIESALGGTRHAPSDPIKHGEKRSRIVVETEDLIVKRTFTAKGSQFDVKRKDGSKVSSPQQMLDALFSPISFDPLEFSRMKPAEQAAMLRDLVGLNFYDEDKKRQEAYEQRTEVGRDIRRLKGALENLPPPPSKTPDNEMSAADLAAEFERRRKVNSENAEKREQLDGLRSTAKRCQQQIKDLEAALAEAREEFKSVSEKGRKLSVEVKSLVDENLDEVSEQIKNVEHLNAAVRTKQERNRMQAELDEQVDESERLTEYMAQIDAVKADAAANAKYPIDGLAVTDDGVTLNDVPFEQASQAQQLCTSVAIGFALNPEIKILLVRDGSLLDESSLRMVAEMAEREDGQVFLERVSMDGEWCDFVIEDGHLKEAA